MKLTAMNELERKVLEMRQAGKPLHGWAREVLVEMTLRAEERGE